MNQTRHELYAIVGSVAPDFDEKLLQLKDLWPAYDMVGYDVPYLSNAKLPANIVANQWSKMQVVANTVSVVPVLVTIAPREEAPCDDSSG